MHKVNIELNPTFTGIVGPNGSGKSNIVDAIKWVLGEQSVKALRGSSGMTDVIFAGSKSRLGSNQASVTIVFDNTDRTLPTDFNEVSIKLIYRLVSSILSSMDFILSSNYTWKKQSVQLQNLLCYQALAVIDWER